MTVIEYAKDKAKTSIIFGMWVVKFEPPEKNKDDKNLDHS